MQSIYRFVLLLISNLILTSLLQAQDDRPNIIFVLTDDQRWDAIGYAGNEIIQTPEMDRLASEGTYFRQALVTTPICAASRASILSGLYERTHKYTFQTGDIREEYMRQAYPRLLKAAGYHTGFFGKFGVNYREAADMFDVMDSYDRNGRFKDHRGYFYKTIDGDTVHLTRYTGQQALDFIEGAPSEKPFCVSLSFSAPHAHDGAELQYFWQEESANLFSNMTMPGPSLGSDEYFGALPKPVRDGFNRVRWYWRYDTPAKYQHSVKGYYRMIHGIDLELIKIRKKLEEKGLADNTIIILMGDNGYFLGERQMAGKWLMYDNSVRVPLIVYDPRIKKHYDIDDMALNVDVPATILDFAGVEIPEHFHGKSLRPIIEGRTSSLGRDTVLIEHLWEFDHIPPSEGVRTPEWKYLRYVNDKTSEELYHLSSDPKEVNNLAHNSAYGEVLRTLRNKNNDLAEKYRDPYSGVPANLSVEFIRHPQRTEIIDLRPEFSWEVPEEASIQKAYQILVSSALELIEKNVGDIWNSGQVRSNKNVGIEFEGVALKPNSEYFWKVRIFDKDNRLGEYSTPQLFRTGEKTSWITSPNYFEVEKIEPTIFERRGEVFFADFGKDAFATLQINYSPESNEKWIIRLGEKLLDDRIDTDPGGHIRYQEVGLDLMPGRSSYQIRLTPDERNTKPGAVALPDSFPVLLPFRFVEIEGPKNLDVENLRQVAYFNFFDETTSAFTSSDDTLNHIWDLCKYSIKATTFAGLYVDGDRERIPYEADAYLNQLSHYTTDREYAIARRTIEYFMEYPTWPTEWQLHVALMFYQDYMYTGNTELIEKYYEPLKHKTLVALEMENGLISTASPAHTGELMALLGFADTTQRVRDIVDWPPAQKDTGWKLATAEGERDGFVFTDYNTVINSLYYQNMIIMTEFAQLLGKGDEALDFELRAARTKHAINTLLFNEEEGCYRDGIGTDHGSVHANMFPLAFNITPDAHKASVAAYIKTRGMGCSVYGAQYLMEALYNAGAEDYALDLLTSTEDRSWYNMIRMGSTISLEAWDMKYKPNADWNHAWGAVPANIIPRGLWGIQPATPGFSRVNIRPQMSTLESTKITVPTIRGPINAEYQKINNRNRQYSFNLPANMVGDLWLDVSSEDVVKLNGVVVNMAYESVRLEPGENVVQIRINSF